MVSKNTDNRIKKVIREKKKSKRTQGKDGPYVWKRGRAGWTPAAAQEVEKDHSSPTIELGIRAPWWKAQQKLDNMQINTEAEQFQIVMRDIKKVKIKRVTFQCPHYPHHTWLF